MIVALIILGAIVAVGLPLYLLDRRDKGEQEHRLSEQSEISQILQPSGLSLSESSATAQKVDSSASADNNEDEVDSEVCCGMHLTCEKDSLLADVSDKVEYFDDEELDRFAGRTPESYSPQEIEEFREVLMTLIPSDISPWARSIQLRSIQLPPEIRDELLFLVAENRK